MMERADVLVDARLVEGQGPTRAGGRDDAERTGVEVLRWIVGAGGLGGPPHLRVPHEEWSTLGLRLHGEQHGRRRRRVERDRVWVYGLPDHRVSCLHREVLWREVE